MNGNNIVTSIQMISGWSVVGKGAYACATGKTEGRNYVSIYVPFPVYRISKNNDTAHCDPLAQPD